MAASFRADSINKKLLAIAGNYAAEAGATTTNIDYHSVESPLFRDDDSPLPVGAQYLADMLHHADGIILAMPEYNWSIPGSFKNLIDWLSVAPNQPLRGKTALLLCASPSLRGGITGLLQLRVPLEHLGMWIYPQVVALGRATEIIDGEVITDEKEAAFLRECINDFVTKTWAMTSAVT
jgi:NAD(P)H-dependent FMN reductase